MGKNINVVVGRGGKVCPECHGWKRDIQGNLCHVCHGTGKKGGGKS